MAVEAFSFTPSPAHEVLTYLGSATVDGREYPVQVRKVKENGIHKSTLIRLATFPPGMTFDEANNVEGQLRYFTENNDVW